ncbi:putative abortive infection phage resistance protein [Desulfamplus magnetovallimortis]|uniref:Putative abortive infection phage resistance protein n=1 Tax=Desulfamplus magnetovallimortis TaxID=1246637 RepID=A0A1W1HE01_9BACT|nr:AIPR family protein [Desulfamplus magnetovallimortis]SLM30618.1 putative abortive infection phage resistance protein [Desulfamplus magnetovallimortis]
MNINASIIDQQLTGILEKNPEWVDHFGKDENRKRSAAFILLCMAKSLDISLEESVELLTEGGNDAGVDGLHIGEVEDGEFLVTIFQGKYKIKDLSGVANFPENGVQKAVNTVQVLFDPFRKVTLNERIAPKIEEIRSLIRDAFIPKVRVILCNNGAAWNDTARQWIDEIKKDFPEKVHFFHFNHDSIVNILQKPKKVDATLHLNGPIIVEDMNYMRVLVGRISVHAISRLFEEHGDRLLQRNIRRYLGLHSNRVNMAIHDTLCSDKSDKFYFYNNGITVVCDKFDYNAFQKADYHVKTVNMQVINGGQTCKTIHQTLKSHGPDIVGESAYVMIRIYQMADENKDFVNDITYATNSQNPVDLRDLHSNDEVQKKLEIDFSGLGFTYKRQKDESSAGANVISSLTVAEAVLAVWREKPHHAKFRRKEHFGKLYEEIFNTLSAAQAIIATRIFRKVENERKRPSSDNPPQFLPYGSHYIAMMIGRFLLQAHGIAIMELSHRNFAEMNTLLDERFATYHGQACESISQALKKCYGDRVISLQQLSATFRRGDLLEMLKPHPDPFLILSESGCPG